MVVNRSVLVDAAKAFNKIFQDAWDKLTPDVEPIEAVAMEVPSSGSSETYDFLDDWPQLQEWVGPRVVKSLAAYDYNIKNKKWEATVGVKREDIEDDRLGLYKPRLQALAIARQHYAELLTEVLESGFDTNCYDGQYFFDNDHAGPSGSQVNVTSNALTADNFRAARALMRAYKSPEGRVLGVKPTICMVGPLKEGAAEDIFDRQFDSNGASNPLYQASKVVVNPWITGYHWFLFDTTKALGPLILQIRKAMIFQMILGSAESDIEGLEELAESVFMLDQYFFGVRARHNAGFGLWQLAYGSNASS